MTGNSDGGKGGKNTCDKCGGNHKTVNCWENAEEVLQRKEKAMKRKAKKGKNKEQNHLTDSPAPPKGPSSPDSTSNSPTNTSPTNNIPEGARRGPCEHDARP